MGPEPGPDLTRAGPGPSVVAASVRPVPSDVPSDVPGPAAHLRAYVDRVTHGDDDASARVRRAMAGESSARFRDRLLLERAAWLARETDRTLQDIAADCGFSGYDVFVRAFRRELGARPSDWRAEPTSWAIDAPGDVHVAPPDGIRLPSRDRMGSVDLVVAMAEQHVRDVGDLVAALPEPDRSGAGPVLAEVVGRMERLASLVHETSYSSRGGLRTRLDLVGPDFVSAVAVLGTQGRFDEAVVDAFSPDPAVVTFGAMVTGAVTDADDLLRTARHRVARVTSA
ncbi:hypothetical protein NOCA1120312 [metagenome]|uniref:HTH araC/xylS-type domain-containing protein n=1 Tax=metagenome TaxID=256318 RepID=A0A2P2C4S8_9ZZZZ